MEVLAVEKRVAQLGDAARRYVRIDASKIVDYLPNYPKKKIQIEVLHQKSKVTGVLIDISKGGLAVLCEGDNLHEDDFVRDDELKVSINFDVTKVVCKTLVRHSDVLAGVGYIGVEFVEIYGNGRIFIHDLIDSILG